MLYKFNTLILIDLTILTFALQRLHAIERNCGGIGIKFGVSTAVFVEDADVHDAS